MFWKNWNNERGETWRESGTDYSYVKKVDQTGCMRDALFRHGVRRADTGASILETIRTMASRVCAPERGHRQLRALALHDLNDGSRDGLGFTRSRHVRRPDEFSAPAVFLVMV